MTAGHDEDELLNNVRYWLYADADEGRDHAPLLPRYHLELAKREARKGNLGPLLKRYPEISDFIAKPAAAKRVRRPRALHKAIRQNHRREQIDTIRRIRKILEQETGQKRVDAELVNDIAARILKCGPDHIREIVKRGD